METFKVMRLDVVIDNAELSKCTDTSALKTYLNDVVGENILTYLSTIPKGWEVGGSCSTDRGCEVHVGGSFRF